MGKFDKTKAEKQATLARAPIDPILRDELNKRRDTAVAGASSVPRDKDVQSYTDLLALQKYRKRTKKGRPPSIRGKIDGKTWSHKKRVEVLTTYMTTGQQKLTSEITGVPVPTIRQWRAQPWWNQLADEIRKEKEHEIDAKLTGIIDKALDTIVNRLEEGEVIYNPRTGEQVRVPVKSIDATRIFDKVHEKRALGRGDPTQRVERITTEQRLNSLAEQFSRFGRGDTIVDGEFEEVQPEGDIDDASKDEETTEVHGGMLDYDGTEEDWEEVSSCEGSEEVSEDEIDGTIS